MTEELELDAEEEIKKISSIYDGDLDFRAIKDNPILKPIAEINETFINLELVINKALIEYQELENEINKMTELNPVYSETMLMSKIQALKNNVKQIIHSQDLQKANMKTKINEMIRIAEEEYEVRGEEEMILEEKPIKKVGRPKKIEEPEEKEDNIEDLRNLGLIKEKKGKDYDDTFEKLKKMTGEGETKKEEEPSEEKEVYSDLVERKIPKEAKK